MRGGEEESVEEGGGRGGGGNDMGGRRADGVDGGEEDVEQREVSNYLLRQCEERDDDVLCRVEELDLLRGPASLPIEDTALSCLRKGVDSGTPAARERRGGAIERRAEERRKSGESLEGGEEGR